MKRVYILYFIVSSFFSYKTAFTQTTEIDSLQLLLKKPIHDTVRLDVLIKISDLCELPDILYYTDQAYELVEKLLKSENVKKRRERLLEHKATIINNIGYYYKSNSELLKALDYYQDAKEVYVKISDEEGLVMALGNIARVHESIGQIEKAIEIYFEALRISEKSENKKSMGVLLHNIGGLNYLIKQEDKALEYYNRALVIAQEIDDKPLLSASLNSLGISFIDSREFDKALHNFEESLSIREKLKDIRGIAFCINNIGLIYSYQGKDKEALIQFKKALELREKSNDKRGMAFSLSHMSQSYLNLKEYNKAIETGERALNIAQQAGYIDNIKTASRILVSVYESVGNYKLAFDRQKLFMQINDSISKSEFKNQAFRQGIQNDYERKKSNDSINNLKEKRIQEIELKRKENEIKAKKQQQYFLYGGLLLVLIFTLVIYNRFRIVRKQKIVIEEKEKLTFLQKEIIEEKHREITDSINYAERIQKSFLATKEMLDDNLREYFVYFNPKEAVSGDFYWASKLINGNFALVCADSTGHGVPGAIMSILNISSLEKSIETNSSPNQILNETRKIIIERLKKDGSAEGGKDGMDCALLSFNFERNKLEFALANNPLWLIRNGELIEYKADKMPVGKHDQQNISFTHHEIEIQFGDYLFIFTDGYADQFGGPKGKKFKYVNLQKILLECTNLKFTQLNYILADEFDRWKGDLEQVDDVCIIGIKI